MMVLPDTPLVRVLREHSVIGLYSGEGDRGMIVCACFFGDGEWADSLIAAWGNWVTHILPLVEAASPATTIVRQRNGRFTPVQRDMESALGRSAMLEGRHV